MYAFFDRHGKKLLAVVSAVLALAFILPTTGLRGGGNAARLGKIDGRAVDVADVQAAGAVLQSAGRVLVPVSDRDGQSHLTPLPQAVFTPDLAGQLTQNPLQLYLLMREARQAGAAFDEREIDRVLAAPAVFDAGDGKTLEMARTSDGVKDALRQDLRQVLGVIALFNRSQSAMKISRPLVDRQLALAGQEVKARVASFAAADFAKAVPAPTPDDLRRQFDAYKGVTPVTADNDPFGFDYHVPDKLSVEWLTVPDAACEQAVIASRPAGRWEEQAIIYYREHQADFPSTQPAATKPAVRPYAEVRDDVLRQLRGPLVEQKKREVVTAVTQKLAAAYQKAKPATTGPAATRPAFESLASVADAVQKQTGVRPTVTVPPTPLSQAELGRTAGFGTTLYVEPPQNWTGGPQLVFDRLKVLHPQSANAPTTNLLDLGQPTPSLLGESGTTVARVTAVEPAHDGSYDAVKSDVERDWRRAKAFDLATAAARKLLDRADAAGDLAKTDAAVQASDWFGASASTPPGVGGDWAGGVVGPAFGLLDGLPSPEALPKRTLARLFRDDRVAVVETFAVRTTRSTADAAAEVQRAVAAAVDSVRQAARQAMNSDPTHAAPDPLTWFGLDAVSARVGYVPDETPKRPAGPADPRNPQSPNNPANPFVPG